MSDKTELLPCPFCGGKAHWPEPEVNIHYVGCMSCAACATGVEDWNRRTALAQQPATVAVPDGITLERIERHAQPAGGCPSSAKVVLLSSLKRLLAAPAAPVAVGQEPVAWKSVVGFEGVYEVSNQGAVRRKDTGSSLKLKAKAGSGYVKCTLHSSGQRVQTYLHRVVCEAFNGPANGREVNHIDGDKENNKAENLEWVSRSENVNHSYYTLGNQIGAVVAENAHGESVEYRSVEEAVRAGFDSAHIYRCLNNQHKKHKGYRWYRPAPPAAEQPDAVMVPRELLKDAERKLLDATHSDRVPNYLSQQAASALFVVRALLGKDGEA